MIPGYNHNIKYSGQIVHVQTEDSGVKNPHIITHLFVGGNIIESRKTSYADIVSNENLDDMIKELMQNQHKAMIKGPIKGEYDENLAIRSKNAYMLDGPAPLNVDAGSQHRASLGIPSGGIAPPPSAKPDAPPPAAPSPVVGELPSADAVDDGGLTMHMSSFFGSAPEPEQFIEAETLQKAFDSKDEAAVDSIFGEDLISEKSLDEVILSYLAEDMQKE